MEGESIKVQKFSSGLNIILRIDILWKDTHKHSRNGEYSKWNGDLDRIWLELARDLNKKEESNTEEEAKSDFAKKEKQFNDINDELKKFMPFIDDGLRGFQKPTGEQADNRINQYDILMKKQMFLARLENELGKGTSYEDEDDEF